MTATDEQRDIIAKVIKAADVALVTTVGENGQLVSRPLALLDDEGTEAAFDGQLWFFTEDPSPKTDQVRDNPQVNVSVRDGMNFVSLAGTASVSKDRAKIDELWNRHAEAWFDNGKDDPAVALLRVDVDSAEYWTIDSPKLVAGVKYAAAIVTGGQPDLGKNETVDL